MSDLADAVLDGSEEEVSWLVEMELDGPTPNLADLDDDGTLAMVRVLVRYALDKVSEERSRRHLNSIQQRDLLHQARINETAARRWARALEQAIGEQPNGESITRRAEELLDRTWSPDYDAGLPF